MPPKKRAAPATPEAPAGRRRSQRISSSGQKSKYFEADSDDSDRGDTRAAKRVKSSGSQRQSAGRRRKVDSDEEEDAYTENDDSEGFEDQEEDENGDDDDTDDDATSEAEERAVKPKKNINGRSRPIKQEKKVEVKRKGVSDDEDDSDGPRVTFIPHKKLRDTGGVEYQDDRLHKNTVLFLKDLKANNKRSWLKANDKEYRRSLEDWYSFVETLTQKITEADETVPELPVKDVIFRIYRDVRFSKDQTPYKTNYSAAWSRTGRKGPYACYYIHCEPGHAFVGGGLWWPDGPKVALLRASIDERPRRWRRALMHEDFRRVFLPKAGADENKVIKAFTELNKVNALKTRPKGFLPDHRDIELLKLRNFTVKKEIPDSYFTDEDGQAKIMEVISAMVPFITHLNDIVMPDPTASDPESEDDEENEENEEDEQEE